MKVFVSLLFGISLLIFGLFGMISSIKIEVNNYFYMGVFVFLTMVSLLFLPFVLPLIKPKSKMR